ncbi:MAG TPA: glycerol acyltransferase [Leeuwenhoekiella sp.]|nr:glycerol acyltransferase [Leeuwenhoekiella sp.]MBH14353.1 glycerol acyltransferase [Leeuwenhoekiella sp.]HAX16790.1 glycerol acyltransferase [Leeuwenhoekiella sp.]HBO29778.1 glycerol acyltransferase [Leeuwenhoekiella sp.]HCQ76072.1 glycerol acyltransferase [Leeuwenhoekiella sp.]|tara:strand:+ start:1320 stop:1754 length:435 start_codon:yes stop_codon:yes gene_type:complete
MANYYPPVGFHFKVEFGAVSPEIDHQFQSVSGLSVDIEMEEYAEGGENRFKHKLPVRTKFPNLVLKRGLVSDSKLIKWCKDAVENFDFSPTDVTIKLLNNEHEPLVTWNVVHAYPVKWSVSDFNAEQNSIAVETIELAYNYFKS